MNNLTRDLISRGSTGSSLGGGAMLSTNCGNCLEAIHELYQELEPQISKSYRPHVQYVPSETPEPRIKPQEQVYMDKSKKAKQLKSVQLMLGAVSEMQKRRDSNVMKKKFGDVARRASQADISQSLPNLAKSDS
ncbi:hypothetical protein ACF0H5_004737 [Mactra antiquata]